MYRSHTRQILERGVLHVVVLVEEDLELLRADTQIRLVEFVLIVPADRPEFPPLLHDGMKEAEGEEQLLEGLPLRRRVEELAIAYRILPRHLTRLLIALISSRRDNERKEGGGERDGDIVLPVGKIA